LASFLLVRDPDPTRRRQALEAARKTLAARSGFDTGSFERGDIAVVWGLWHEAPRDFASTEQWDALLIGEAIPGPGPGRVSASAWGVEWAHSITPPAPHDGHHLAITVTDPGRITIAGDLLGFLPVGYATPGDVLLVASNPGLFRSHPLFREELDPVAVTAILMTNSLIGGATIQRGVRRLAAGFVLRTEPGGPPFEQLQFRPVVSRRHHGVPAADCEWRLHEALRAAVRRQVLPGVRNTLLLSGGLDSRLQAGVLALEQMPVEAVTRGSPKDNEYQCARRVAAALGIPHRLVRDEPGGYAEFQAAIRWNGMTASPGSGAGALLRRIQERAPRVISGYGMDALVGGSHISWCYSSQNHTTGFEPFFRQLNSYGIAVENLRRLLRPHVFGDSVDQVLELVRTTWQALGDSDLERTWRYDLQHRQRFYIGAVLNRLTNGGWPCTPHIDREVIEVAGGIPLALLADRRLEQDILIRFHNRLAGLPLDRNALDTTLLDPGMKELLRQRARRALQGLARRMGVRDRERRYYYRIFDFDGPRWRSVRQGAEAARGAAYEFFDRDTFDALVPRPGQSDMMRDPIAGSAGAKALLGIVAWLTPDGTG
jgi:asparagine synthase (glutamine-hydrolysing)